ncbi:MAG: hypothetical protein ACM359_24815 [Bacillota bacterium]
MRLWITGLLMAGLLLLGCNKPKAGSFRAMTTTTTRPATTDQASPSVAPTTAPVISQLQIGDQVISFPRARLMLMQSQPDLALLLFSDDPRDALAADYSGNRYYFEIQLDIDDVARLAAADWHFKAPSIERADSPTGIFLDGDRKQLQPYDVDIVFGRAGSQITLSLSGQFLMFQARDHIAIPRTVPVQGVLVADLETRDRPKKADLRPPSPDNQQPAPTH